MNRGSVKLIVATLAVVWLVGFSVPSQVAGVTFTAQQTQDFVERLYDVVLQRTPDSPGLAGNVSLALSLGDDFVRSRLALHRVDHRVGVQRQQGIDVVRRDDPRVLREAT